MNNPFVKATRALSAFLAFATLPASAQFYRPGDVIAPFTLTQRGSSVPLRLEDFTGKIVFLEWFAWWCPFCQAAAPQVEQGIVRYYTERNGNPHGIPVVHIAVNLQSGQETQTQNFITRAGFHFVAEDFSRTLAGRFQSGGQPIFAIINGVTNSPSHKPWELLLHQNGYGTTQSPIERFRAVIDAVQPAPPSADPPHIDTPPQPIRAALGAAARLEVAASGTGPILFQWFKDGVEIPGSTRPLLEWTRLQRADAGSYTVRVSNSVATRTSEPVSVTVFGPASAPPTLTLERPTASGSNLRLRIHTLPDAQLRIQHSTDLATWMDGSNLVTTTSVQVVELPLDAASRTTFWRVVSP